MFQVAKFYRNHVDVCRSKGFVHILVIYEEPDCAASTSTINVLVMMKMGEAQCWRQAAPPCWKLYPPRLLLSISFLVWDFINK